MNERIWSAAAALGAAASLAQTAHAGAFYLQEQSARGAGRAFSGEAADTGAASLWWNPAAIAGMTGGDADIGLSAILPHGDARNDGTQIIRPGLEPLPQPVGGDQVSHDPINNGFLPSGAIAHALTRELSVGLAVTSPYSFTTNYDATSWARYTADKTRLRTVDLQPSIGFAPVPSLRLGAGLNVEHASASLSNYLPNLSPLLPDGHQTLSGKGWDVGFTAGAQFVAGPLTLGASYKSSVKHRLSGAVAIDGLLGPIAAENGTQATHASFRTPWQVDIAARWALSPKLTLDGQVNRIGWSKFDAIRLGDPFDQALPENYRNTWSYALGFDYAVASAWTVRAGVQRDLTPTRSDLRDARVPDGDRWNYALGSTVALSHAIGIDLAADYLSVADVAIDRPTAAFAGTSVQTPILPHGRFDNAHVLVFALGAHLAF